MNGMVDSRVVEMHFDNSDFMDKITETIEALERLNEQISSINQTQGLKNVGAGMGQDMSNVANAVGNIEQRFSALGIVGMTVIQRLTNAGIDMALKIGNGIRAVGNQIKTGGFIRAEKLEQAKFLLEGLGADVEGVMARVNEAVDGTAYGLDEAAKASASFFASGIKDMDKMEATLKSVSGVAALVGSDYSSIAEIFTTVAGQGKLMTMQLRQLESRGLNAAAYLAEYFGTTEEAVREMVTEGEVSFEDFTAAMSRFADHAKDANKTFSGSMANMKTALSRLGEAFITPAMQAAIPVFNGIREAISAFTSELKVDLPANNGLITTFTNAVSGLGTELFILFRLLNGGTFSEDEIKSFSEFASRDLVKMAETSRSTHSIFKDFAVSVGNIGGMIICAFQRIRDAFSTVFPNATVENFKAVMMTFNAAISRFARAHGSLEGVYNVFVGIFSLFKAAGNIISGVVKVFAALIKAITGFVSKSTSVSEGFMNISKALSDMTGTIGIFDLLVSAIDGASKVIGKAFDTIFKGIGKFLKSINESVSGIGNFNNALGLLGLAYAAFFAEKKTRKAKFWSQRLGRIFLQGKKLFETVTHETDEALVHFNDLFDGLNNNLRAMERSTNADIIKKIALALLALAIALKILSTIDPGDLAKSLGAVTALMTEMTVVTAILMKLLSGGDLSKNLKNIYALGAVTNALIKIGVAMILMASALKIIAELDTKQLASGLIGMTVMLGAILGFVIVLDKFQTNVADAKVGTMMIGIALALTLIAKAVKAMGSLKPTELAKGLGAVIIVMTAIFGFMAALNKMGAKSSGGMVLAGLGMIAIATAINILTPALQKLGSMSLEQMAKGLATMAIAMVSMAAVSQAMSFGGAAGMLVMAAALSSLGITIERLGSLDIITIAKGLGTIIAAIAALGVAAVILAPASAALLALGAAMILVSASFAIFGAGLIMIGTGLTSISAGIMSFSSVTSTAVGMFVNTVKLLLQELINLLPSLAAAIAESFVTFLEQIAELAPRFTEAVTTIVHSLLEAVENNLPDIIAAGIRLILNFLEGMEEAIPRITESVATIISGFLNALAEKMPDIIDAGFNLMLSFINGLANGIREHKDDFRKAIENLCEAGLEAFLSFFGIASPSKVMEEQGVNLILGLINGVSGMAGSFMTALVGAVTTAFSKVKNFGSRFMTAGRNIVNGIISGIKSRAAQIGSNIRTAITKGLSAITGFVSRFMTAGGNLVKGIAQGIKNGASHVISAAGSIAKRALDHFKSKLGISSPSKVFAEAAKWIPEGIVVGINKTSDNVVKAAGSLADSTVDTMTEAISKVYDILDSGDDFNPVITPVLDLSEVKNEAGNISSMFGTETVSLASSIGQNDIQNIQNNNLMNQLLTKMDRMLNTNSSNPVNISNTFTVNGNDNPEEFVNTFIRTLDREMQMRAV